MAETLSSLRSALEERDRLLGFSSRLDTLHSEGSLTDAEYRTGRADYDGRTAIATGRVQALRTAVRKELKACVRELELSQLKLKEAEARHLAGELSEAEYQTEARRCKAHLSRIGERCADMELALEAESSADLGDIGITALSQEPHTTTDMAERTPPAAARRQSAERTAGPFTGRRAWTKLRVAALAMAAVLLVSVRLAWLAPTELLGRNLGAEAGVSVTFLAGLGGIICGLTALGLSFVRKAPLRGVLQAAAGVIALAALLAAILLREIPIHDSYFRDLIVLREGFFAYVVAALTLTVLGVLERRRQA